MSKKVKVTPDTKALIRTRMREILTNNEELKLTDAQISEIIREETSSDFSREQVRIYRYRYNNGGLGNPLPETRSVAYRG